jgi:hypothetical protein
MPEKSRSVQKQPLTEGVLPLAPGGSPYRSRRPARGSEAIAGKEDPERGERMSRRVGRPSLGSRRPSGEDRVISAPAEIPATAEATPKKAPAARKGGTTTRKASGRSVVRRRSSKVQALPVSPAPAIVTEVVAEAVATPVANAEYVPGVEEPSPGELEETARLAYSYWEARGYQGGSAEEDWFRARAEIRQRKESAKETRPRARARKAKT